MVWRRDNILEVPVDDAVVVQVHQPNKTELGINEAHRSLVAITV